MVECACTVGFVERGEEEGLDVRIAYCPVHEAAFVLLDALENILFLANNWRGDEPIEPVVAGIARTAIDDARLRAASN